MVILFKLKVKHPLQQNICIGIFQTVLLKANRELVLQTLEIGENRQKLHIICKGEGSLCEHSIISLNHELWKNRIFRPWVHTIKVKGDALKKRLHHTHHIYFSHIYFNTINYVIKCLGFHTFEYKLIYLLVVVHS